MLARKLGAIVALVLLAACGPRAQRRSAEAAAPAAAAFGEATAAGPRLGMPRRAGADLMEAAPEDDEHPNDPRHVTPGDARLSEMAPPAEALGAPVFFGLMHAHSFISDGSGTPEEAFVGAKAAGLDFFGVTPHNHAAAEQGAKDSRKDGVLIANTPELYNGTTSVRVTRRFRENGQDQEVEVEAASLRSAATAATSSNFVALFGQEFSTISSGNHANVFQPSAVIAGIPNGAYRPLYEQFGTPANAPSTVIQFNHPDVHADFFYGGSDAKKISQMFNDYGYDEYGEDFSRLVEAAHPVVALTEVLSGPALDPHEHPTFHYGASQLHENDYYFYLVQGFHVSPSVGQDNHFTTWGSATPARMGVYATARTPEAIIAAMRANRTYASEDSDLILAFSCNGMPMGSTLEADAGATIQCEVSVTDPGDTDTHVNVDLIYGDVQPARNRASLVEWRPSDGITESRAFDGPVVLAFDEYQARGVPEFFFVRIQQADGDRAWSAPIWFNHPRTR